jgi:hypothetical protein
MYGDRLGELNCKAVGIGSNNRAVGLIVLFPGESKDDLVAGRWRRLASDEDAVGADVMNEFSMDFLVDDIINRNHTFPSVIRTSAGHKNVTCIFHDAYPHLLVNRSAASPFVPSQLRDRYPGIGVHAQPFNVDCAWTTRQKRRLKKRLTSQYSNLLANSYPFDRYFFYFNIYS